MGNQAGLRLLHRKIQSYKLQRNPTTLVRKESCEDEEDCKDFISAKL